MSCAGMPEVPSCRCVDEDRAGGVKSRICARPFNKASKPKDLLYAPTPASSTMKLLLVLAQKLRYQLKFFDISRAFLQHSHPGGCVLAAAS